LDLDWNDLRFVTASCTIKSAIRSENGKTLLGQLTPCMGLVGKFPTILYGKNRVDLNTVLTCCSYKRCCDCQTVF